MIFHQKAFTIAAMASQIASPSSKQATINY